MIEYQTEQEKEGIQMGMTMTQKILAAHAGLESVTAGQLIEAKLKQTPEMRPEVRQRTVLV